MKLQLNRKHIHPDLFEELAFDDYLKKFEIHLPFLSTMILAPLSKEEGLKHFESLANILEQIETEKMASMFAAVGGIKNARSLAKEKNKRQRGF